MNEIKYEILSLNPDRQSDKYKVFSEVSTMRQKKIEWDLLSVAQSELIKIDAVVSAYAVEVWINQFSSRCPAALKIILCNIIEPITPKAESVEWLFDNDKLDWDFIQGATEVFTGGSLLKELTRQIANSREESQTNLPVTELKTIEESPKEQVLQ